MLLYGLIGLSLVLVGIVGLQFTYMFYLERLHVERKKYLSQLEKKCIGLTEKLDAADRRIAEQRELIEQVYPEMAATDEVWAEVIEDR
jgi:hypothetical protein